MKDANKTKQQLIVELTEARQQIAEMQVIISTHTQAQEEKLMSEQRYLQLIEQAGDGIFLLDKDQRFIIVNSKGCEMLGYTKDEMRNLTILDTYPDELLDPAKKRQDLIRTSGSHRFERPMKRKDGTTFLIEARVTVLKDGTFQGIVHDITSQRQAEEALKKSEALYRTIFENTGNATVLLGADTTILLANSNFEKLSGFSREELEGKISWTSFVDKEDLSRMRQYHELRRKESGSAPETYEFKFINRNSVMKYIFLSVALIPGTSDSIASLMDITERKQAEKELQEKTEELDRFFSVALDLLCIADTDGNFRLLNPAWERTLGYTRDELMSKKFLEFIHPEDVDSTLEAVNVLASQREVINFQNRYQCKDGSYRWIEWRSVPAGNLIYAAAHDITDRKLAEDTLRAVAKEWQITFDAVGSAVWLLDDNQRILRANHATSTIFGKDPGDVIGHFCWEIVHKSSCPLPECPAIRAQNTLRRESMELPIGDRWLEVVVDPVLNDEGRLQGLIHIVDDITERKEAERQIQKSEEKYRTLVENLNVGVYRNTGGPHGQFLEANPALIKMFGYESFEEIIKLPISGFYLNPEERKFYMEEIQQSGSMKDKELAMKKKDGSPIWVSISAKAQYNENGEIKWMDGVLEDITEQKKAEEMLSRQITLFRNLFESSPEAIAVLDQEDRILEMNRAFESLFGYTQTEATGHRINDLLAPGPYLKDAQDTTQAVIRNGQIIQKEGIRCTKDGRPVHVSLIGYPIVLNGLQIGAFAIYRDITVQKQAQEELLESEERFRLAFLTSPDAININQLNDGMYVDINEGFTVLTGFTRGNVIGKTSIEINIWHDPDDRKKLLRGLRDNGYYENLEAQFRRKDGSIGTGLMSARIINLKGIPHILSITRDITELKRAEEEKDKLEAQLIQAQKMESIGRLAGGVAHDYNNMLSAILGHVEMAKEKCPPSEPIYNDLEVIEKAAKRSATLTRQLLAFARRQTVTLKILDLNDVVAGMLKMLQRLIGEDIDFAWMPGAGLWQVKIDPSQIDQILANLCVNARDAIDSIGKITIETENIVLDESYCAIHPGTLCGQFVMLAVSDDGRGMNKEILDQIFEPFFTTKDIGKGTGLGLATVYGIVKQNNGFINVYSEPGKGSTFKVYLPRFQGTDTEPKVENMTETIIGGKETVLLVEDEEVILNLGKVILEKLGYHVLAAGTPSEALRIAKMHVGEIQLLITDVIMPEMNGHDLVQSINNIKPGIKCLYISGYTANVIVHRGILDEGVHFLQKPFSMKDLAEKVRIALEQD
jgi:two-component system, cell cycle sensor histidine kinase and response regulator CckA